MAEMVTSNESVFELAWTDFKHKQLCVILYEYVFVSFLFLCNVY